MPDCERELVRFRRRVRDFVDLVASGFKITMQSLA
jgi:hypothetical protein